MVTEYRTHADDALDDEALQRVLDLVSDGVLCLHPDGRVQLNRAARTMLGADDLAAAHRALRGEGGPVVLCEDGSRAGASLLDLARGLPAADDASPSLVGLVGDAGARWVRLRRHRLEDWTQTVLMTDVTEKVAAGGPDALAEDQSRERLAAWGADFTVGYPALRELFLGECMQLLHSSAAACALVRESDAVIEDALGDWQAVRGRSVLTGTLSGPAAIIGELAEHRILFTGPTQTVVWAQLGLSQGSHGLVAVAVDGGRRPGAQARLERFVAAVGPIIAHRYTLHALQTSAGRDPLTGLPALSEFLDHAEREAALAARRRRPVSVVLWDLDGLGEISHRVGPQIADQTISAVAERLERALAARGGTNLMARIGGDSFAWLMVGADALTAETAAELGRSQVSAAPFVEVGPVSVSAGVCDFTGERDVQQVMRLARGALYWAKSHGRGQVCRYRAEVVNDLSPADTVNRLEKEGAANGLRALAKAIDLKDTTTREHSVRVARIADQLTAELGWDEQRSQLLHDACLVHDVGKIGVPDSILFKPGILTPSERELVQQHSAMGARICAEFLTPEQTAWVRGHHERWDGGGYPDGLPGERIPDGARVLFVADSLDAMTSNRPCRARRPLPEALAECRRVSGSQLEPAIVEALFAIADRGELDWLLSEEPHPRIPG